MDWCFSVGVLLAFGAGQFFGVQKCPTPYKWFAVPSPCWLNASSKPSQCKNQTYKDLPHIHQVQMPSWEGSTTSLQYHCLLQFEDTQEKSACQNTFSASLAFISLGSESFLPPFILTYYLPVLQGGGDWFAVAVLMGIALASPCMYVQKRCHMKQIFPLFGLTILLPNSTVAHSLCPCHAWLCPRAWLSHKRDGWQSKQNLWSVRSPLDFTW